MDRRRHRIHQFAQQQLVRLRTLYAALQFGHVGADAEDSAFPRPLFSDQRPTAGGPLDQIGRRRVAVRFGPFRDPAIDVIALRDAVLGYALAKDLGVGNARHQRVRRQRRQFVEAVIAQEQPLIRAEHGQPLIHMIETVQQAGKPLLRALKGATLGPGSGSGAVVSHLPLRKSTMKCSLSDIPCWPPGSD